MAGGRVRGVIERLGVPQGPIPPGKPPPPLAGRGGFPGGMGTAHAAVTVITTK